MLLCYYKSMENVDNKPGSPRREKTMKQITVWPEDESTWIVSRDNDASDTIAVFANESEALRKGRQVANAEGLPLYRQDEHGLAVAIDRS